MEKEKITEALRGRLRCIHAHTRGGYPCCGNEANAGGRAAGYMAKHRGLCHLMHDAACGVVCSSCDFACGGWYRELLVCHDDGEVREVLKKACVGWTPPSATNRIPGEAEP